MKSEDGTGSRHALVVLKEMWEGHPTCFIQAVGRRFRSPALFLFLFMIEYRLNTIIGVKDGRERGQNMDYGTILEKRDRLKALRSFIPEYTLLTFENAFEIEYTHNSTAIEGNTLTLMETKVLLEDGISIGGKHMREIYEVVNHQNAYRYVKECIEKKDASGRKNCKRYSCDVDGAYFYGRDLSKYRSLYLWRAAYAPAAE